MRRFGFSSAVALFILALVAAPSWACVDPGVSVSQNPVHPGDTVSFNIINLTANADQPADWTIKVGDTEWLSGSASSGTYTGTFKMPDAGPSATPVSVELIVQHGDIDNADQTTPDTAHPGIQYAGRAAAPEPGAESSPTPAGSVPATAEQQAQHNGSATPAPPSTAPGQAESAVPPSGRGGGPTAARPRTPARHGSRVAERHAAATSPRTRAALPVPGRAAVAADVTPAIATTAVSPRSPAHARRPHRAATAPVTQARARAPVASSTEPVASRQRVPAEERAISPPWPAIAALGALLALAVFRWRRGRGDAWPTAPPPPAPPPDAVADPRDLAIEAELQELIAEENARRPDAPAAVP